MRMFKKEEGFTLVELMVVVLIIGILVAIAIPVFNAASESARRRSCHANQRTIEGAVQQYLADNSTLTIADCDTIGALIPSYVRSLPACPSNGPAYTITNGIVASCTAGSPVHNHY